MMFETLWMFFRPVMEQHRSYLISILIVFSIEDFLFSQNLLGFRTFTLCFPLILHSFEIILYKEICRRGVSISSENSWIRRFQSRTID